MYKITCMPTFYCVQYSVAIQYCTYVTGVHLGGGVPPLRNCQDAALCKNTVHSKMMNIALITVINKESQKCLQTVVTVVHIISQQ